MSSIEKRFDVAGLTLAGKHWQNSDGLPTLALHGWLDNANTFDRLAPYLQELDLVALDFAGHGYSGHRAPGVHYSTLLDIQDVLGVANALGWEKFRLLGHSMGASVASELAAVFPERVESAVMIDGFTATGGVSQEERFDQNREAIERMLAPAKTPRAFPDTDTMAQRVTEATDQSMDAARVLVERGHRTTDNGVTWRSDPRIRFPTPMRYTLQQVDQLIPRTTSPALLLVATEGDKWYQSEIALREQSHPNLTVKYLKGPHHLHLEPAHCDDVLKEIRSFWKLDSTASAVA